MVAPMPDLHSRFHPDKDRKGPRLLVRFKELQELGVVGDWASLYDLIKRHGFPAGFKISHKVRVWDQDEVLAWLETRRAA
jgi:predicted DNA-binding transcriptional regulator AlpA